VPALHLDAVSKRYGEITALDELSMAIEAGELFGLLGPNGAGKTTTMEILSRQIVPDSGSVSVLGVDPVEQPTEVRSKIGILPESEAPPSFLTPREYFHFVASVRNLPDDTVPERTRNWAERLGFSGVLDTLCAELSRGQQQKVMFAGAFLHEPSLVIIDEPLANLDPVVQQRVKEFLHTYQEAGNTVLISTHDVSVAAELCTRVGILHTGELVADVRPAELPADQTLLDVFIDNVGSAVETEVTSSG
jgi:ABC-2 type transport system ATP-binding protein